MLSARSTIKPDNVTRDSEKGVSLVEFSIVAPLMAFLFIAVVDFSLYLQSYFIANHSMREGLRMAAGTPAVNSSASRASIRARMDVLNNLERQPGQDQMKTTGALATTVNCIGDVVTITVTGQYRPIFPNFFANFSTVNYTLRGEAPYLYSNC